MKWGCNSTIDEDVESKFRTVEGFPMDFGEKFDLLVASDVVYLPECVEPLLNSIKYFLS